MSGSRSRPVSRRRRARLVLLAAYVDRRPGARRVGRIRQRRGRGDSGGREPPCEPAVGCRRALSDARHREPARATGSCWNSSASRSAGLSRRGWPDAPVSPWNAVRNLSASVTDLRSCRRRSVHGRRCEVRARLHERAGADWRRAARGRQLDLHRDVFRIGAYVLAPMARRLWR